MAGAFLARPDDATAASWNPAGLSYLRSLEVSLVGAHNSLEVLQRDENASVTRSDERSGRGPDFLAATYPIELRSVTGSLQLSFQRAISFDGDRTIERASPPTTRQFETIGGFDVIALGSGVQATRRLRLGFTLNRWLNGYSYASERSGARPSQQTTDFDFSGWNVNLGLIWSPLEELNLGAVYKTPFTARIDLNRSRTDLTTSPSSNQFRSSAVRFDFPAAFGLGASWRPTSPLTLSADYTLTNWSDARIRNYFTLPPAGPPPPGEDFFESLPYPTLDVSQRQKDTQQLRAGVEYVILKSQLKWPLRAGYIADRQLFSVFNARTGQVDATPIYHGVTAGTGLIVGRALIDVAYVYTFGSYREIDLEVDDPVPRNNVVRSHRVFLSLIYRHKR